MVVISRVVLWFMFLSVNCKASLDYQKFMGKYLSQDTFITKLFRANELIRNLLH